MASRKWCIGFVSALCFCLGVIAAVTIVIDPYIHYHKPMNQLQYPLYKSKQRYQNDGIERFFDYNAIITGTSMTENFKSSEVDKLFGVHSIKVPFSGGTYKEINENLSRAVSYNSHIKIVIRGLDYRMLLDDKDVMRYDENMYPVYLYDDKLYNDVKYWFNKDILIDGTWEVIQFNLEGGKTPTFDEYSTWADEFVYGEDAVLAEYERMRECQVSIPITKEDYTCVWENFNQNVLKLAEDNPSIEFYFFFTPYSIYWWDNIKQEGLLERQLEAEKYAIQLMLKYENIHLFSFFTNYDMICNPNNYKDIMHYNADINSQILQWMKKGKYELTEENYEAYCDAVYEFYMSYDYESLFSK